MQNNQFINVNFDALCRISGAASDEETRYYLQGVCVEANAHAGGVNLIATNGQILAVEFDYLGSIGQFAQPPIIAVEAINHLCVEAKRLCKAWRTTTEKLRLRLDTSGEYSFMLDETHSNGKIPSALAQFIDATFPEWRRIVPSILPGQEMLAADCLDVELLARLARTAIANKKSPAGVLLYRAKDPKSKDGNDLGSPMVVTVQGRAHWLGVVMPMRAGETPGPRPAWLFKPEEFAAAAA